MAEGLRLTTLQKCRLLLDHLGIPQSPYASSTEVIGLLKQKLIDKKDDPTTKDLLKQLVAEMKEEGKRGRLACPDCEDISPDEMALSLASVLSGSPGQKMSPGQHKFLKVLAGVMVIAVVGTSIPNVSECIDLVRERRCSQFQLGAADQGILRDEFCSLSVSDIVKGLGMGLVLTVFDPFDTEDISTMYKGVDY